MRNGGNGVTGPQGDTGWFATNLDLWSDVVIVVSVDSTILWVNEAVERLLGWGSDEVVGRSFAEFVHPDDLTRAAEVVELVEAGVFEEDLVMPALYDVRSAEGTWIPLELSASLRATDAGEMIISGRFTGDLVYGNKLLEAVTGGAPIEEQIGLVLDLGRWRYPREGYVVVYREAGGYAAASTPGVPAGLAGPHSTLGSLPWHTAVESETTVECADLSVEADECSLLTPALAQLARDEGFLAVLAVPVPDSGYGEDAAIMVWSRRSGPCLAGRRYAVRSMVQALTLVLQQQSHRLRLERAAYVDHLTGLWNRRRFMQLLDRADDELEEGRHVALYVDMDRFKGVNDRFGHAVGDHVLAAAAGRLAAVLPEDALVGRVGGDEFGVLCQPGTSQEAVDRLIGRIEEVMGHPIAHERGRTVVGATVGHHIGEPGESARQVLDRADRALVAAKGSRMPPASLDGSF